MTDKPFSRRDFLKTAGVGAAAFAVSPKLVNELDIQNPQKKEDFGRFGRIETENAYYYPFFERHDQRPDLVKTMSQWPQKPTVHFFELVTAASVKFQEEDALSALFLEGGYKLKGSEIASGRVTDDQVLDFFTANGTSVAFEGINLPEKYFKFSETAILGETFVASAASLLVASLNKKEKLLPNLGAAASVLWACGHELTGLLSAELEKRAFGTEDYQEVRDALLNVETLIRNFHPENMVVFFRNLIMARKLQTLAHYFGNGTEKKPDISFTAGFGHAGIKDLLILGESVTLAGLNLYPTEVLRDIVNANGGIDAFCRTMVVPVREVIVGGQNNKSLVIDQPLKVFLETRLEE